MSLFGAIVQSVHRKFNYHVESVHLLELYRESLPAYHSGNRPEMLGWSEMSSEATFYDNIDESIRLDRLSVNIVLIHSIRLSKHALQKFSGSTA
ncbi:unnamed protein product [Gongylonema pulchrum]|uniref:Transposase n=1 Tax=Gongylonema pulchrum TaxID=637853 RepID=A0A183E6P1_9BILA|nr:unnamed protein product [Gongylonema pulchrum]